MLILTVECTIVFLQLMYVVLRYVFSLSFYGIRWKLCCQCFYYFFFFLQCAHQWRLQDFKRERTWTFVREECLIHSWGNRMIITLSVSLCHSSCAQKCPALCVLCFTFPLCVHMCMCIGQSLVSRQTGELIG